MDKMVLSLKEQRGSECRIKGVDCRKVLQRGSVVQGLAEGEFGLKGHPERVSRERIL